MVEGPLNGVQVLDLASLDTAAGIVGEADGPAGNRLPADPTHFGGEEEKLHQPKGAGVEQKDHGSPPILGDLAVPIVDLERLLSAARSVRLAEGLVDLLARGQCLWVAARVRHEGGAAGSEQESQ